MAGIDLTRALTFGRLSAEYARWRPSYPDDAVDWLLPPGAARVADVGAGTGQLTARLLERDLFVDAVEPERERRLEDAEELVARVCAETGPAHRGPAPCRPLLPLAAGLTPPSR